MNVKHTPGPWTVSQPTDKLHAIRSANGRIVADVGYSGTLDGDAANARLIAAAPDLLEALRRCRFDSLNMTLEYLNFCKAAYAKATGEPV